MGAATASFVGERGTRGTEARERDALGAHPKSRKAGGGEQRSRAAARAARRRETGGVAARRRPRRSRGRPTATGAAAEGDRRADWSGYRGRSYSLPLIGNSGMCGRPWSPDGLRCRVQAHGGLGLGLRPARDLRRACYATNARRRLFERCSAYCFCQSIDGNRSQPEDQDLRRGLQRCRSVDNAEPCDNKRQSSWHVDCSRYCHWESDNADQPAGRTALQCRHQSC